MKGTRKTTARHSIAGTDVTKHTLEVHIDRPAEAPTAGADEAGLEQLVVLRPTSGA
ncbi:MAG: hypothetical protein KatS3mg077_1182 [Candidatus Binatia bacterium]|nr:MAG: hypothetical protein KatS3mg077_1182 [Candidatus Binatia bacterium]